MHICVVLKSIVVFLFSCNKCNISKTYNIENLDCLYCLYCIKKSKLKLIRNCLKACAVFAKKYCYQSKLTVNWKDIQLVELQIFFYNNCEIRTFSMQFDID